MRTIATFIVCISLSALPIRSYSQTPQSAPPVPDPGTSPVDSPAPTRYGQLVDRLKAGDRTVSFTEARTAFTETPAYSGTMMLFYRSLWGALNMRDFEGALKVVDTVLARDYVEPNAHMVASIAHSQLGHNEEAQLHRFIADGLLQSITSQGDGKTSETAYHVIDVSEEYALFRALNLTPRSQSAGPPSGGSIVDRMVVVDPRTNEERVMYFSVDDQTVLRGRASQPR
jgi:hypothetical protein